MSETPKYKALGGSRGLANMLRQNSANPSTIVGYSGADLDATPTIKSNQNSGSRDASPTPMKISTPISPPPKPAPPAPTPPTKAPVSPNSTNDGPIVTKVEQTVIKNTNFERPAPPTRPRMPADASTAVFSETEDLAEVSPTNIAKPVPPPVSKPVPPPPASKPSPPPTNPAPVKSSPPPQIPLPTKVIEPEPKAPQIESAVPSNISLASGKKGTNIQIGAKAGGVYAEACYVGDGDEVDDSEW